MKAWDVYRPSKNPNREWYLIDTVFWVDNADGEEVWRGLVNHGSYPPDIVVRHDDPNNPGTYPEQD